MIKKALFVLAMAYGGVVLGAATPCPQHFNAGAAPDVVNPKMTAKTRTLCFSGYALLHSGLTRTALWSAEYLTAGRLADSRSMKRQNAFHAEESLPESERSELSDYAHSGFDRGHMSPSGDMPDARSQHESFSLANMVPQNANNNQHLWVAIEESTRKLAKKRGALYVVTGPIFMGSSLQRINGQVLVPTQLYKAIYDPSTRRAAAYLTPNAPGDEYRVISITELETLSGISPFPTLDRATKEAGMALPQPVLRGRRSY
jgi:endonuclease G